MNNSERFLKAISDIIENGILSSKDAKKEILTNLKFQKEISEMAYPGPF